MAIDRARRLLDAAFDSIPTGVIVQDLSGEIVASNRPARVALGMEVDDLHGRRNTDEAWSIVDREGHPIAPEDFPTMVVLRTARPLMGRIVGLRRGESTSWTFLDCVPLFDDAGELEGTASYFRDANATVHNEAQHARLLDEMSDAYVALGPDARYTFVNRSAAKILDDGRGEPLVGQVFLERFPSLAGSIYEESFLAALSGESVRFEGYVAELDRWLEVRAHPVADGVVAYFSDVTERRRAEAERTELLQRAEQARVRLVHAATRDSLTGLYNRESLSQWISQRVTGETPVAVVFVDLDHFKRVNDTLGHAEGDALLVEVAQRLTSLVRPGDAVARLGGDEFVLAIEAPCQDPAYQLVRRVLTALREPVSSRGRRLVVTGSIGVAFSTPASTSETLLRDADAALYQAKDAGRNRCATFDDRARAVLEARLETESELLGMVERDELRAHYQAMFDSRTGEPVAVESLARWAHPRRGLVGAGDFIPVAEESGLIVEIGDRMVDLAIRDLARVSQATGNDMVRVWVNVSVRQLDEPGFTERLGERLTDRDLVGRIGIEVTETAVARDELDTAESLRALALAGVPIAIDDFGTGYSSLARLIDFPVDMLKIDQAFVQGVFTHQTMPAVKAMVDLAHAIGARSCAEGIETPAQLRTMAELGVDLLSGYHLGHPAAVDDLDAALVSPRRSMDELLQRVTLI